MAKKEHTLFMVYTTQISLFQGCLYDSINHTILSWKIRYRPRFFDQVGHQTMYAFMGNKHFFSLNNIIVRPTKIMNRADKNWAHF